MIRNLERGFPVNAAVMGDLDWRVLGGPIGILIGSPSEENEDE